jgi:hypothetical protein
MIEANSTQLRPGTMPWYALIWLFVIIAFDALGAISLMFFNHIVVDKTEPHVSLSWALFYFLDDVVTIFFAVAILRWKRWGVWGLLSTSVLVILGTFAYAGSTPTTWGVLQFVVLLAVLFAGGRRSVWARFPKS